MACFLGIDPGVSGGISVLNDDGTVVIAAKMPTTDRDLWDLVRIYTPRLACRSSAVIERVGPHPKEGVHSVFVFGQGYGRLVMALTAAMIPFSEVAPQVWQRVMQCRTKGDKNVSKRRAQQLFPAVKMTHLLADSLLIAEFGRRSALGLHGPLFRSEKSA